MAAAERPEARRWRITVRDYGSGIAYVYDERAESRWTAVQAAVGRYQTAHPEAGYGDTYGVEQVVEL